MILILNYQLIDGIFDGIIMCIACMVCIAPCHASRLSVTICPIKMPLFKMRCFMPESYNVLKICLEVIVAIENYSQFNYVFTSTNAQVY